MRTMYFGALVIVGCVAVVLSAPHQGSIEHDTIDFFYDPVGKFFVARTDSNCYMAKLTALEQDRVHTNRGMEDLEIAMMRDMLGKVNETRVYHDATSQSNIQHWCSDRDLYVLERGIEMMSTAMTLIG